MATEAVAALNTKEAGIKQHQSDASVHLDAVRGLAALAVFLGHGRPMFLNSRLRDALGVGQSAAPAASSTSTASTSLPAAEVVPTAVGEHETIGHEAVVVFFVLSGYFVGGSVLRATQKGIFSWQKYLFQRLTRLWVVLIPALILGWALDAGGMNLLPHGDQNIYSSPAGQDEVQPGLAERLTPSVFLGNLFFLQTIWYRTFGSNVSLWSLSYEFWYYVFFPFLVAVFLPRKSAVERIVSALLLVGMFGIFGLELSRYFLVWLFGAGVALLPLRLSASQRRFVTAAAGLVFVVALVAMLKAKLDLFVSDLILSVVFSGFLWTILHATRATVNGYYRTLAQGLSNMSYTLYSVHMPFLAIVCALVMPVWRPWTLSARSVVMLLAVYGAVFLASWVVYAIFERNTDKIRARLSAFTG